MERTQKRVLAGRHVFFNSRTCNFNKCLLCGKAECRNALLDLSDLAETEESGIGNQR